MEFLLVLFLIGAIASVVVFLRQKKDDKKMTEDAAAKEAAKKTPVELEHKEYQGECLYRFSPTRSCKSCGQCGCENLPKSSVCMLCGEKL